MTRADRLNPAIDVAAHREKEIGRTLAAAREDLAQQEQRLATLVAYLDDYNAQHAGVARMRPAMLSERRAFLSRLDRAVREQQLRVTSARGRLEDMAASWRESRSRVQALERAADRIRSEERLVAGRREQAATDEAGSRVASRWHAS